MLLDLPMKLIKTPLNPYDIHCMVYEAMLGDAQNVKRNFLFKHIPDLGGMVLVRSVSFPDHLQSVTRPVEIPANGARRQFDLVAAPMKKENGKTKALPPNDPASRISWLKRMGERHGFEVVVATVSSRPVHYDRKGAKFWLERSVFYGELVVTDSDKLALALESGIGRARSLGHGMLRWIK